MIARRLSFDFIGSDILDAPELHDNPLVGYLNLREQRAGVGFLEKVKRVIAYYLRLICYAARSEAGIFQILWNNKFELFDRTVLMAYYKLLGKKIALTAHNVNAGIRDDGDSFLNRLSLLYQYQLSDQYLSTQKK